MQDLLSWLASTVPPVPNRARAATADIRDMIARLYLVVLWATSTSSSPPDGSSASGFWKTQEEILDFFNLFYK